jgi:hypothetical protein
MQQQASSLKAAQALGKHRPDFGAAGFHQVCHFCFTIPLGAIGRFGIVFHVCRGTMAAPAAHLQHGAEGDGGCDADQASSCNAPVHN